MKYKLAVAIFISQIKNINFLFLNHMYKSLVVVSVSVMFVLPYTSQYFLYRFVPLCNLIAK